MGDSKKEVQVKVEVPEVNLKLEFHGKIRDVLDLTIKSLKTYKKKLPRMKRTDEKLKPKYHFLSLFTQLFLILIIFGELYWILFYDLLYWGNTFNFWAYVDKYFVIAFCLVLYSTLEVLQSHPEILRKRLRRNKTRKNKSKKAKRAPPAKENPCKLKDGYVGFLKKLPKNMDYPTDCPDCPHFVECTGIKK